MSLLGIDLGGTKLALALFRNDAGIISKETVAISRKQGRDVGRLICEKASEKVKEASKHGDAVKSVGVSVPGIYHSSTGKVWAPNIPGWDDYPLLDEMKAALNETHVSIDSDRACYISGEFWQGNARGCSNAIFLAVGTGIGAGIMINGEILRGQNDIAGAIGWMALSGSYDASYDECGCFESFASGEGIAKQARRLLIEKGTIKSVLREIPFEKLTAVDVFSAFSSGDTIAQEVIGTAVRYWGMASANLVSLFNPEKIIFGGGVFGPAISLLQNIKNEARKWAQPVSITQVSFEATALGGDAGVVGAGYLAMKNLV